VVKSRSAARRRAMGARLWGLGEDLGNGKNEGRPGYAYEKTSDDDKMSSQKYGPSRENLAIVRSLTTTERTPWPKLPKLLDESGRNSADCRFALRRTKVREMGGEAREGRPCHTARYMEN
jgi:hypothetical protein